MTKPNTPEPDEEAGEAEEQQLPFADHSTELHDTVDWSSINMDDFGTKFEAVADTDDEEVVAAKPKRQVTASPKVSKFIRGRSPFIYYLIQPRLREYKMRKTRPINEGFKVTSKEVTAWQKTLAGNIKKVSAFYERELLPLTAAVSTAVLDTQERFAQLIDDPQAKLPLSYIVRKLSQATNLKIIDHIADTMKLSPENRRLMKTEFYPHTQNQAPPNGDQGKNQT